MAQVQKDIVTQIQENLDRLSVSLFSTTGALQRDAQPVSVRGEPVAPAQSQSKPSQELAELWAAEMLTLSKAVEELIQMLPEVNTSEGAELQRIAAAMAANDQVGDELRTEVQRTEQLLQLVRSLHAALADAELAQRASMLTR